MTKSPQPQLRPWREIAVIVREWMVRKDVSQSELAAMLGHKSGSTLSRYLTGAKEWSIPTLYRVAEIIGVDPRRFFYWPVHEDSFLVGRDAALAIIEKKFAEAVDEIRALDYVGDSTGTD